MSDTISVSVPRLTPLTTSHQLRDATVRDYIRAAERAGLTVDAAAIMRLAVSDCEMVDRYNSEATPVSRGTSANAADYSDRMTVEGEANALDCTTVIDPRRVKRSPIAAWHGHRGACGDRWDYAKGRAARIMAGATPHKDRVVSYSTCELPHLAYALFRVYANLALRRAWRPRPGDEPNPYYGLSNVDVNRLLQRQVEDICDLSTGRLGPWLVPK